MIAVLGTRGGIGTTTLAVNLGVSLAADPNHTAALVDLDLSLGDADIALEVNGQDVISIADLARNIERLDMNYLRRAMVRYEDGGLAILRHPIEIQDVGLIHEAHVERVLNLLKISNTHLVLDLSKSLLPTDLMALRLADTILLVAQLELSSLRNVVRMAHYLGLEDGLATKVKVVLNRVGAESADEGIGLRKAEEVIGRPIFWQVPYDPKPVAAARVAGAPLLRHSPKSRAQQSIAGLAKAVCTKPVTPKPATASTTTESRKSGWALFGRR
jgi:pilus assembly protein CpaE